MIPPRRSTRTRKAQSYTVDPLASLAPQGDASSEASMTSPSRITIRIRFSGASTSSPSTSSSPQAVSSSEVALTPRLRNPRVQKPKAKISSPLARSSRLADLSSQASMSPWTLPDRHEHGLAVLRQYFASKAVDAQPAVYYFAYGADMSTKALQHRCPDAQVHQPGLLEDYKWTLDEQAMSPVAVRVRRHKGDVVYGRVFKITFEDHESLAKWYAEEHHRVEAMKNASGSGNGKEKAEQESVWVEKIVEVRLLEIGDTASLDNMCRPVDDVPEWQDKVRYVKAVCFVGNRQTGDFFDSSDFTSAVTQDDLRSISTTVSAPYTKSHTLGAVSPHISSNIKVEDIPNDPSSSNLATNLLGGSSTVCASTLAPNLRMSNYPESNIRDQPVPTALKRHLVLTHHIRSQTSVHINRFSRSSIRKFRKAAKLPLFSKAAKDPRCIAALLDGIHRLPVCDTSKLLANSADPMQINVDEDCVDEDDKAEKERTAMVKRNMAEEIVEGINAGVREAVGSVPGMPVAWVAKYVTPFVRESRTEVKPKADILKKKLAAKSKAAKLRAARRRK